MFFFFPHYSTTIADTGYGRGGSLLAHFILQSLAVTRASDPVPFAILGFCAALIFQYESAMNGIGSYAAPRKSREPFSP